MTGKATITFQLPMPLKAKVDADAKKRDMKVAAWLRLLIKRAK